MSGLPTDRSVATACGFTLDRDVSGHQPDPTRPDGDALRHWTWRTGTTKPAENHW